MNESNLKGDSKVGSAVYGLEARGGAVEQHQELGKCLPSTNLSAMTIHRQGNEQRTIGDLALYSIVRIYHWNLCTSAIIHTHEACIPADSNPDAGLQLQSHWESYPARSQAAPRLRPHLRGRMQWGERCLAFTKNNNGTRTSGHQWKQKE